MLVSHIVLDCCCSVLVSAAGACTGTSCTIQLPFILGGHHVKCWLQDPLSCALYCSKLLLLQEFAAEKELCWDLCMALGLCRRHSALAQALAKATLSERHSPMEWRASAQVG